MNKKIIEKEKIIMNEENIKVGNVWIEDYDSVTKKYFLLASIFVSILFISATNPCFLAITMLIYTIMFFCIVNSVHFPPSFDDTMIVIHYSTNVNFSKNIGWYPKMFDRMKEYYENEDLNEKSQKYKIKKIIYLYDSNAENAKKWFEEQNKKVKII